STGCGRPRYRGRRVQRAAGLALSPRGESSVERIPRTGAAAAARTRSGAAVGGVATPTCVDGSAATVRGERRIPLVERRGAAARAAQPLGPFAEPLQDLELVAAVPATILIERHLPSSSQVFYPRRAPFFVAVRAAARRRTPGWQSGGMRQVAVELSPELSEVELDLRQRRRAVPVVHRQGDMERPRVVHQELDLALDR